MVFRKVEKEIWDCREENDLEAWTDSCQQLLKASHGMDVKDFISLLDFILQRRISSLSQPQTLFESRKFGPNHLLFDIGKIREVSDLLQTELGSKEYNHIRSQCEQIHDECTKIIRTNQEEQNKS